ncbi:MULTISPECIES: hypothetical protein [Dehalococcoides]|jgi:hypothetical protein|uniref:hypothetical protein n=1 Tax=Dehalococcoides TaxID=61434 RepID=UPI0003C80F33|nr:MULTISPECIES: hypothetical protein [Dehalococcoides]AHB14067.1 hypothetical protein GY50_1296 [Dehalococcoides mccartyi GY50]AII58409.1 hypothetical protein X792_06880 [Dehalococcoides mccartyi CG1]APH12980.1 hypothetical protein ASJ33_07330 [Dehalococcoides mccartyi]QYY57613.1 hypothetical protein CWV2_000837 [Dehalococcoides mccartyi]BAQ35177.1 hypothetical protein UCH007_12190 [Dehalococcoides sp. UCH007]
MRKRVLALFAGLVILALPLSACSAAIPVAGLDQSISFPPGQSCSIAGEDLIIKFVGVVSDSRCPEGVQCVWEGEVTVQMEIKYGGAKTKFYMVKRGAGGDAVANFGIYTLSFNVTPYPIAGTEITKDQYRLLLTVSKT